jgi:hypothetical protein
MRNKMNPLALVGCKDEAAERLCLDRHFYVPALLTVACTQRERVPGQL